MSESDKRLELAYDAAAKTLTMQDTTLGNVRTRANNLLATAALFTSFSAGVGLINTDPKKGAVLSSGSGGALLAAVILLGISVLVVVWPTKKWHFGPSATAILAQVDQGKDEIALRRFVTDAMISGIAENKKSLAWKQRFFRAAVVLLVGEVSVLIWILTWGANA
jgi:hypothetical protein